MIKDLDTIEDYLLKAERGNQEKFKEYIEQMKDERQDLVAIARKFMTLNTQLETEKA